MRELSLFTGAGGGLLGTKLLGWHTVGYVEFDDYCQKVLAQRIQDGFLDEAPIFGDIDHFIESGASKKYAGFVDVVTAGFPCQPFSNAGKQKGEKDPRNKWPQTIQTIRDVRPRFALLENVPGLLNSGYFHEILGSLAESGFDVRWDCISAAAVGAPHRRDRLWILAKSQHPDPNGLGSHREEEHFLRGLESNDEQISIFGSVGQVLADSESESGDGSDDNTRISMGREQVSQSGNRSWSNDVADSDSGRCGQQSEQPQAESVPDAAAMQGPSRANVADSERIGQQRSRKPIGSSDTETNQTRQTSRFNDGGEREQGWWDIEPDVGRVANGVASRVDRLKALGNGQCPAVAATAGRILTTQYTRHEQTKI